MPRRAGAKDRGQRKRRKMTAAERTTRALQRQSAEGKRRVAAVVAEKSSRAAFVERFAAGSSSAANADDDNDDEPSDSESDDAPGEGAAGDGMESGREPDDEPRGHAASDGMHGDVQPPPPPRREQRPDDIEAELDDDAQFDGADAPGGVMATYLEAVFWRLHAEVRGQVAKQLREPKWLLQMLKAEGADWWLRAGRARTVCSRLGLEYGEPSYYRDIHVWRRKELQVPAAEVHQLGGTAFIREW